MTRHRTREQRHEEILGAAIDEIDRNGYVRFTMDSLVARSGLSKGGLYRHFPNRRAVVKALVWHITGRLSEFDAGQALAWNLPVKETLLAITVGGSWREEEGLRLRRVLVQLMPEVVFDPEVGEVWRRRDIDIMRRYGRLIRRLVQRDRLPVVRGFNRRLVAAIRIGEALLHGISLQGLRGASPEELTLAMGRFIDLMTRDMLEETHG